MAETFWSAQSADPKRKFRWYVEFTNTEGNLLQLSAKMVKKPSFEIGNTQHKWINHTFNFPGRLEWKEVTLSLVDIGSATKDVTATLQSIIENSGYRAPVDADIAKVSITKNNSVAAFGNNFRIRQIDAEGNPVETWTLINPWVRMLEFGDLDYASDDLVELSLTIVYDYAEFEGGGDGNRLSAGNILKSLL
tara:strand:- start:43 stop:618 length:576 start_codon:yes stop_codon:yes gene_type:complete